MAYLTPDDAVMLLNADAMADQVETSFIEWQPLLPPEGCTTDGTGNPCDEVRADRNPLARKFEPTSSPLAIGAGRGRGRGRESSRFILEPGRDSQGRRLIRRNGVMSPGTSLIRASGSDRPFTLMPPDGWSCGDVAVAVNQLRHNSFSAARAVSNTFLQALRSVGVTVAANGVPTLLRSTVGVLVNAETELANASDLWMQMQLYESWGWMLGCRAAPGYHVSSAITGEYQPNGIGSLPAGYYVQTCREEFWRWSRDGGATFVGEWIEVCETDYVPSMS